MLINKQGLKVLPEVAMVAVVPPDAMEVPPALSNPAAKGGLGLLLHFCLLSSSVYHTYRWCFTGLQRLSICLLRSGPPGFRLSSLSLLQLLLET